MITVNQFSEILMQCIIRLQEHVNVVKDANSFSVENVTKEYVKDDIHNGCTFARVKFTIDLFETPNEEYDDPRSTIINRTLLLHQLDKIVDEL